MNAAALLFIALLAQSSPMVANPEARARAKMLLGEGSARYGSGDYAGALEKFKEAHATYASPKIWFNIGQAYRDLGRFAESLVAFEKFLDGASDASSETRTDARKAVRELQPKLGHLRIECQIPGADVTDVTIDGQSVGRPPLPEPIWMMPGRHQITALSPEASPVVETVEVVAGTESQVVLKSNPLPVPASTPAPVAEKPPEENARPSVQATAISKHSDGWWLGRKWTWVAAGSAVVLAAGAVTAGLAMQSKFDSLNGSCGIASQDQQGCTQGDLKALDTRRNAANVMWGLAGAAVATTGVLFYLEGRPVTIAPLAGEATGLLANVRY